MENNDLLVFGQQDVKLNQIRFIDGCLNTLQSVLRKQARIASMSDDQWPLF